jgi:hypothetical protein
MSQELNINTDRYSSIGISAKESFNEVEVEVDVPDVTPTPSPVEFISAETVIEDNTSSGNIGVTIPADATLIIVAVTGWLDQGSQISLVDQLNFDNGSDQDFTHIISEDYDSTTSDASVVSALYMASGSGDWPGSGAATLYWRFENDTTPIEGCSIQVSYWKGNDPIIPIGDTDSRQELGDWVSALAGVGPSDMGVIVGYEYNQTPETTTNGQTTILDSLYNVSGIGHGYKLGESAMQLLEGGTFLDVVGIAFVIKAPTASPYVDFTPYTEVDSGGDITVTPYKADVVSMLEDEVSWLVYDYGASYLSGDFTQRIKGVFTTGNGTVSNIIWAWTSVATGGFTVQDFIDNNDGFILQFRHVVSDYTVMLYDASTDITDDYILGTSPPYEVYIELERVSSTLTAKIYSNSDFTGLLATLSVSCNSAAMRYHVVVASREQVGPDAQTYSSENFNLNP